MSKRLAQLFVLVALTSCRHNECISGPECNDTGSGNPVATTVTVSPLDHTFTSIGESQLFSAVVLDQSGNVMPGAAVSWQSIDRAIVAISSAGLATSFGPGVTSVVASSGTISGSADVTVGQIAATLVLSPQSLTLRGIGDSIQIGVSVTDANGNTVPQPAVTWASSDTTIATIDGQGLVRAVSLGTAAVTAAAGQIADTTTVSVLPFVPTADLLLTKSVVVSPATFGDTVTYEITATNLGPDDATNVVLRDSLPSSLIYTSHATSTGVFSVATGLWTVGAIAVNDTVTLSLSAVVVAAGVVSNSVTVTSQDQADTVTVNDVATTPTSVAPDTVTSTLQMSVDNLAPSEGDTLTFTLTYQNAGPDELPTVDVVSSLPAGLTWVSATPSIGSYSDPVWTIPTLALNATATLQVAASVDASVAGQSLTHLAYVVGVGTHFDPVLADDTASVTNTIQFPPLAVTTASLPNGAPTVAYNQTLLATGGNGGNSWLVTVGQLPTGLSLAANGDITGTPTGSTQTFTVEVTSDDAQSATQALTLTISATLNITTTSLPNGVVGIGYGSSIVAVGGDGNNTWSVIGGSLPTGMTLNPTSGALGGILGLRGTFNFTVQVVSADGQSDTQALQISVFTVLQITTTSPLPNACCGGTYNFQLQATGGAGGYTWSLTFGSLPSGWTLSSSGLISGDRRDQNGPTFSFVVRVRSGDGQSRTRSLTVAFVIGEE